VKYFIENPDDRIGLGINDYTVTYAESDAYMSTQMPCKGERLLIDEIIAGEQALHHRGIFAYEDISPPPSPTKMVEAPSPPPSPPKMVEAPSPPPSPPKMVEAPSPPPSPHKMVEAPSPPKMVEAPSPPPPQPMLYVVKMTPVHPNEQDPKDVITNPRTSGRLNGRKRIDFAAVAAGRV
jgi:hypothetical protein